jgi:alkylation response protein AidB-like acyl-CoA dehydrogenase
LQHRVIECHVLIEGATWAAREAAYRGAPSELAGSAAVAAVEAAGRTLFEVHQLSGAIGFTDEYDLTLSSLRLQTLRTEAGGIAAHARALVESRWG